jgi:membrane-associated protease RseP (regulator of RpoE activity)
MMQDVPSRPVTVEEIEALRRELVDLFALQDVTMDWPQPGFVRFRGRFMCDLADCFDELRTRFERHGFTPSVRREELLLDSEGQPDSFAMSADEIVLLAMPAVFAPTPSRWSINLVLFLLTILTTLFAGALHDPAFTGTELWLGWPFSLSMLLILGAHELGHYFAARYHRVPVTLPYFIPMLSIIGTLGAFIRLKAPMKNRRAMLDIGVAGPLAGLVFAVPLLVWGLLISEVGPLPETGYYLEGNSILYATIKVLLFGQLLPAGGIDVSLSQVAWAGWVGLLVTGLNLFPVGQLDGGHVAYVLFGRRARQLYWPVIFGLILLAVLTQTLMWGIWVALLFFFGRYHAEPLDSVTPLDGRRRAIAIFTLLLFIFVFVPIPLRIVTP